MNSNLNTQEFKKVILAEMDKLAVENKLAGFEKIKNVYLTLEPFSIENNLLTPKMSLKRHEAKKIFLNHLNAMYEEV